jgi:hypothetical protein
MKEWSIFEEIKVGLQIKIFKKNFTGKKPNPSKKSWIEGDQIM